MFKDQVIVITGGSSGLGKALAQRLVREGAHLALIAAIKKSLQRFRTNFWPRAGRGRRLKFFRVMCRILTLLEKPLIQSTALCLRRTCW